MFRYLHTQALFGAAPRPHYAYPWRFLPAPRLRLTAGRPFSPHAPTLNWLGAALLWGRDRTSKAGYRHSPSNTLATSPTDDEQLAT